MEVRVKRSNNELFHSSSFLGEEFSDELYHWKYIRKEKVRGKWKYYYKKSPAEKFEWGYKLGNKKDSFGNPINKSNIDPNVYAKLANSYHDYGEALVDPFYRGRETHEIKKEIERAYERMTDNATQYYMAKSVMGKLGQFTGRTVAKVEREIAQGKEYLDKIFNRN